ncbi:MAG TPA: hypothetical protein PKA42_03710, partial [Candidatus Paceibacterota bacterium]|nr:hypothetical protein [Candidatus Paceibacterota bacterium]
MSYKNDNILGKKVILFGTNTRQISSLEQVLLYAGADVVTFTDTIKGRQQIPISQADVIIFDDSAIPNAVEVVRSIKTKMINSHAAWLIIHNTYTADVYQPLFADNNIAYVPKNIYDVAEVLKGLSSLMKQKPSPTNEIKLDLQSQSPPSVSPSHEVRVMIFEDDPLLQNILSLNLKRANINFQISASGQNFKSLIEAYKPTVVLLDLTLDGLNGLQI